MSWSKPASERRAERADTTGKVYVKTFNSPRTDVRFLWDDPYNTFEEHKEHFDRFTAAPGNTKPGLSYPCARYGGLEHCIGCEYPLPDDHDPNPQMGDNGKPKKCKCKGCQVRDRSSRYVFPVLNETGYVQIYKIGYRFWELLCGKFTLLGTITNCDYGVTKIGDDFNNTQYDANPLPGTEGPRTPKIRIPSIDKLLANKYLEACQAYGIDPASVGFDPSLGGEIVVETVDAETGSDPSPDAPHVDDPETGTEPAAEGDSAEPGPTVDEIAGLQQTLAGWKVPYPADATVDQLRSLVATFAPTHQAAPAAQPPAAAAAAAVAAPPAPAAAPAAATNGAAANGNGQAADSGTVDYAQWTTPDLRDQLSEWKVDFPARAPRSVLLKLIGSEGLKREAGF